MEWIFKQPQISKQEINIALIGKYVELKDSYFSIAESLIHAGSKNKTKVNLHWIHSSKLEDENCGELLEGINGIIVAPGFGSRAIEGKIKAVEYARIKKIPFLGICLGMQCAVIEFARNVLKMENAHSIEIDSQSKYPVISMMKEQKQLEKMGGTMRLGSYQCDIEKTLYYKFIPENDKDIDIDLNLTINLRTNLNQMEWFFLERI